MSPHARTVRPDPLHGDEVPPARADGPPAAEYDGQKDFARALEVGYAHIRARMAQGGPGWDPTPRLTPQPTNTPQQLKRTPR